MSGAYRWSDEAAPNVPRRYLGGTSEVHLLYHRVGIEIVRGWYRDGTEVIIGEVIDNK